MSNHNDNDWPKGKKFGELTRNQQKAAIHRACVKIANDRGFKHALAALAGVRPDEVVITAKPLEEDPE
jgi:hypothetical protein